MMARGSISGGGGSGNAPQASEMKRRKESALDDGKLAHAMKEAERGKERDRREAASSRLPYER